MMTRLIFILFTLSSNKFGGSLSSLSPPSRYTSPNTSRAKMGETEEDDGDYDYTSKWEYLGQGIWENQVSSPGLLTDQSSVS